MKIKKTKIFEQSRLSWLNAFELDGFVISNKKGLRRLLILMASAAILCTSLSCSFRPEIIFGHSELPFERNLRLANSLHAIDNFFDNRNITLIGSFSEGFSKFMRVSSADLDFAGGFVNEKNEIVIRTDGVMRSFSEGYALSMKDAGKVGFIDKRGEVIIPHMFGYPRSLGATPRAGYQSRWSNIFNGFSEGLAVVWLDEKWGFINKRGELVAQPQFELAGAPSEGLAPVKLNDLWGFIDTSGKIVIQPQFQHPDRRLTDEYIFSEGRAVVLIDDKFGYINPLGEIVIEPVFEEAKAFSEGLAVVVTSDYKYGYIDANGNVVIDPIFDNAYSFSEGLAAVTLDIDSKVGYIDKSGEFIIEPRFAEGLAPVKIGDLWGYVDIKGNIVVEPQFYMANEFSEGTALVCQLRSGNVCRPLHKADLI